MRRVPPVCRRLVVAAVAAVSLTAIAVPLAAAGPAPAVPSANAHFDGLGIAPGRVKHVWLIIMENKSFDASFTGLNNNTFLWQTLPSQGVLLENYYGTGHFSQDNYISMVAGQAPITDTQSDCPQYANATGSVSTTGSLTSNPNFGQFASAAGPNAAPGQMGCVYPSSVPTVFNQLDSAHISWKGYAQDLTAAAADSPQHSTGVASCGAPFATPGTIGDAAHPNPGAADATDQYVPKHFPFPWFHSLLDNSHDCNAAHIADVFDPANGLFHDLQHESTTPAVSWITPNNCSDAHDAVCHGNNLSGGFSDPNTPKPPVNFTGGLFAGDLFLEHVVPEIEASPAFKDGGLIDVTFDEAFPPFTYTGNSFADSTTELPNASASLASDAAGETLFGKTVHSEPTGPNTPLLSDARGDALYPGPGDNSFIDRPANCVAQTVPPQPAGTCLLGGGGSRRAPGPTPLPRRRPGRRRSPTTRSSPTTSAARSQAPESRPGRSSGRSRTSRWPRRSRPRAAASPRPGRSRSSATPACRSTRRARSAASCWRPAPRRTTRCSPRPGRRPAAATPAAC